MTRPTSEGLERREPQPPGRKHPVEAVRLEKVLDAVDGDPEPEPDAARQRHAHDAHRAAILVEHGPAAAAGVDGGVGLEIARAALLALAHRRDRPPADAGLGHRLRVHRPARLEHASEREAEDHDGIARLQRVGIAQGDEREVGARHGQDRDVEVGVGGLDVRVKAGAVRGQDDLDPRHVHLDPHRAAPALQPRLFPGHHVVVGEDVAGGRDHEAAAGAQLDVPFLGGLLPGSLVLGADLSDDADEDGRPRGGIGLGRGEAAVGQDRERERCGPHDRSVVPRHQRKPSSRPRPSRT